MGIVSEVEGSVLPTESKGSSLGRGQAGMEGFGFFVALSALSTSLKYGWARFCCYY